MENKFFYLHKYIVLFPLLILIILSFLILITIFNFTDYGFDFTDEASYLISMKYPKIYYTNTSQFGFIYNPLYNIFNGNLQYLRNFNILFTYFLASFLSYLIISKIFLNLTNKFFKLIFAFSFSLISIVIFKLWLLTPNYNTLNFQGLLIFTIGIYINKYFLKKDNFFIEVISYFMIALGGFFVFMAKITSAGLLLIVYTFYILNEKKDLKKNIIYPIFFFCILFSLLLFSFDFSFYSYIERLINNINLARIFGGGYTIFEIIRMDYPILNFTSIIIIFIITIIFLLFANVRKQPPSYSIAIAICLLLFISLDLFNLKKSSYEFLSNINILTLFFAVILFCTVQFFLSNNNLVRNTNFFYLLLFLPFVYAFGSNGNYWEIGSHVSLFWLLALLYPFYRGVSQKNIFTCMFILVFLIQIFIFHILKYSLINPYRQPPNIFENSQVVIYNNRNTLMLNSLFTDYINTVKKNLKLSGFNNDYIIDLSGQSPGLLFFLEAKPLGFAWLTGGYSGSESMIIKALSYSSCSAISESWILYEPNGPRSLSADILLPSGINITKDFKKVFSIEVPNYLGGYNKRPKQIFYKPANSKLIKNNCEIKRSS